MHVSASPKRSRSTWPLALGFSGHPMPRITPEHMHLARELTDGTDTSNDGRATARGTLAQRLLEAFLRGLEAAGRAHATARGQMLH